MVATTACFIQKESPEARVYTTVLLGTARLNFGTRTHAFWSAYCVYTTKKFGLKSLGSARLNWERHSYIRSENLDLT